MCAFLLNSTEFASNIYGWDFAISIFSVAVYSHRSQTVCKPFPLEFCHSDESGEISSAAITNVVQCLEQIPPVQLMADDKRTLLHVSDWTLQVKMVPESHHRAVYIARTYIEFILLTLLELI